MLILFHLNLTSLHSTPKNFHQPWKKHKRHETRVFLFVFHPKKNYQELTIAFIFLKPKLVILVNLNCKSNVQLFFLPTCFISHFLETLCRDLFLCVDLLYVI